MAPAFGGGGYLIANNTVVDNFNNNAFVHGAGIHVETSATMIRNNIVAFNRGAQGFSAGAGIRAPGPAVHCNDSWGNDGPNYLIDNDTGTGNLSLDPQFCDPPAGNYAIRATSPCAPGAGACGLMGALDPACDVTPTTRSTWGRLKSVYR